MLNDMYDLKNLMFNLAFEAKELLEAYENRKLELQEYVQDLENGKVTKEVRKYMKERYNIIINDKNLEPYINTLKNDIFIIEEKTKILYKRKEKLFRTSKILRTYEYISFEEIKIIREELINLGVDNKTLYLINEKIKIHNNKIDNLDKDYKQSNNIHQLFNMLQFGYEYIPVNNNFNSDVKKLNEEVMKIINLLESNSFKIAQDNINLDEFYSQNDLKYIYGKVLRYYQTDMQDIVNILLEENSFYFDNELLLELKSNYYKTLNRYMYIRKLYDNIKSEDYKYEDDLEEIQEEDFYGNKLYYSSMSSDPSKCYFVKDLMNIREDALCNIQNLINDFKSGKTNNAKKITIGALELKYDQIRIILRRIKGNCYSVLGVFIKKSDNLHDIYAMVVNRKDALIDDEYSQEVEDYYNNYIDNNKRTGSR